jgi:hypothetical protein
MGHSSMQMLLDAYGHLLPPLSEQPTEDLEAVQKPPRVVQRGAATVRRSYRLILWLHEIRG